MRRGWCPGEAAAVVLDADAEQFVVGVHVRGDVDARGIGVPVGVLHRLLGDGEELAGHGVRDGECGVGLGGGPVGRLEGRTGAEVPGAGGQFLEYVRGGGLVPAQVCQEFAGLRRRSAGCSGHQPGLSFEQGRVRGGGGRRCRQAFRGQGHAVEGLRHRVVHLPCQAGPFLADRLRHRQAGLHRGEGLGRRAEAEQEVAQGGADRARDHAEAREEKDVGGSRVRVREGCLGQEQDQGLQGREDRGASPAVGDTGEERGADADVGERGVGARGDQEEAGEEGVRGEEAGVAQEEGAEAFPVPEEGVRHHEGDDDRRADQAGAEAGVGVEEGGGGGEGDHGQPEAEDLAAHGLKGVDLEVQRGYVGGPHPAFGGVGVPARTRRRHRPPPTSP